MGLQAGQFDQRVRIEQRDVTGREPNGEEIVAWVPVATVWAAVEPLRAREWFAAGQEQSGVDHRVTVRYRTDIGREMRVVWLGRDLVMDIVGEPIDVRGRRENLELMCQSGVRNTE